jgi:hypothetical protein
MPAPDLPGASIQGAGPLGGLPAQQPWNPAAAPTSPFANQPPFAVPPGTSGGPLDAMGGLPYAGPVPGQGASPFGPDFQPQPPSSGVPATYVSPHPTPKAPQNLTLYRPSIPEGVEARKLSPLPSVSVREYPYLRRGQTTDKFITPPGMEMPEAVGQTTGELTWRDRLRNLFDPLGVLGR